MKTTDFRIIELPTHQILLMKDFDDDDENSPLVTVTFFWDGVKCVQKLGYSTEEKRNSMFDEMDQTKAQVILDAVINMFQDND